MDLAFTLLSLSWEFDTADHSFPLPNLQVPDFFPSLIGFSLSVSFADFPILTKPLKTVGFFRSGSLPFRTLPSLSHSSLGVTTTDELSNPISIFLGEAPPLSSRLAHPTSSLIFQLAYPTNISHLKCSKHETKPGSHSG